MMRALVQLRPLRLADGSRRARARWWGADAGRRTIIVALIAACGLILLHDLQGSWIAEDRLKRIHELEALQAQLYERLAQQDAQRESQRSVYIERIRKGETQLRENAQEIMTLRPRSDVNSVTLGSPPRSRD